MHIKHLKHGTGSGQNAANYFTQEKDSTGKIRDEITVLRGDPHQVAAVADSLSFKHKYTSGVISWASEDQPTDAEIKTVLDDYEKLAFSGFEPDQYAFSAVLHREEDKGLHIHTFAARVDLYSGKSFNPAPPGHQYAFDALRDMHNYSHGWARPDDPARARLQQPGQHAYITAAQVRAGMQVEPDTRGFVGAYLTQRVKAGEIENRQGVLDALHEAGLETPRAGKNYVTVRDPESGEKFRLKGALYNADFQCHDLERPLTTENGERQAADRSLDAERVEEARRKFEEICQSRAGFNQKKYGRGLQEGPEIYKEPSESVSLSDRLQPGNNRPGQDPENLNPDLSVDHRNGPASGGDHRGGDVRAELVLAKSVENDLESEGPGRENLSVDRTEDFGNGDFELREKGILRSVRTEVSDRKEPERGGDSLRPGPGRDLVKEEVKNGINRTGTDADRICAEIATAADTNNRRLAKTSRAIERSSRDIDKSLCQFSPDLLRANGERVMNDEISRFKSDINLAEYAASRGFEKDPRKSGQHSTVMKREGETLCIFRGRGGDDVFAHFGTGKSGSVIDFHQAETGDNLGHTRKALRSYLGAPMPEIRIARPQPKLSREEQAKVLVQEQSSLRPLDTRYLKSRGIPARLLNDPRFKGQIFCDARGNTCFPHYNSKGFTGAEKRNDAFKGYTKHGDKGLWYSKPPKNFKSVVFCESGIDALSHAALHPFNDAAYISISGQMSMEQEAEIKALLERCKDKEIVAAFDNDIVGKKYEADLDRICKDAGAAAPRRDAPAERKDWSEVLDATPKQVVEDRQQMAEAFENLSHPEDHIQQHQAEQKRQRNRDRGMSL